MGRISKQIQGPEGVQFETLECHYLWDKIKIQEKEHLKYIILCVQSVHIIYEFNLINQIT